MRWLARALLLGVCAAMASCREPAASFTAPPSTIDAKPVNFWGPPFPDFPPEPDGGPHDPTGGLGVQKFADQLIGRRIALFAGHRLTPLRAGPDLQDFLAAAEIGPGPGMCRARVYQIASTYGGRSKQIATGPGEWIGYAYSVAGSVAPLAEPWPPEYARRLAQACRQKTDMDMWYRAEPERAYLAARLADEVVATARMPDDTPFPLRCIAGYGPQKLDSDWCSADVRKTIASIKPRAIISMGECYEASANCLAIEFPKRLERTTYVPDRWTLEVHFIQGHDLRIERADLADTQVTID